MSSPDAVFRTLQAVVLIFFPLMDSFLFFDPSALHRHDEPILPWWQSQTHPCFAMSGRRIFTSCEIVRHSTALSVQPFPVPPASANLCPPPFDVRVPHSSFKRLNITTSSHQSTHVHISQWIDIMVDACLISFGLESSRVKYSDYSLFP